MSRHAHYQSTPGSIKFVSFAFSIFFLIHSTCSALNIPRKALNDWWRRMWSTIGSNSSAQKLSGLTLYTCSVPPSARSHLLTQCGQRQVVHLLRLQCALSRVKWFPVDLEPNSSVANGHGISQVSVSSPQNVPLLLKIFSTSSMPALHWSIPESGWEASLMTTALSSLRWRSSPPFLLLLPPPLQNHFANVCWIAPPSQWWFLLCSWRGWLSSSTSTTSPGHGYMQFIGRDYKYLAGGIHCKIPRS